MPFGFKFGRQEEPVPEWANFFTRPQYDEFIRNVDAYFRRAGSAVEHEPDTPRITVSGGSFPEGQYGLMNLAQVCNMCESEQWPDRIAEHFDSLVAAQMDREQFKVEEADFSQVKDLLAVRIGHEESVPTDILCFRRDLHGTISYLVFDLPNSVEAVANDLPKKWGRSLDELFAIALDNVLKNTKPDVEQVDVEPGLAFTAYSGDSFFTASFALLLERLPHAVGRYGTLVATPHRHMMLCHALDSIEAVQLVHHMGILAENLDREGPGSISPKLYWYHDGTFVDLPFKIEGENFNFYPPEDFVNMLNALDAKSPRE